SKINETQQQTEERIIQHSEAVVETIAQIPQEDQTDVKETKLNTDTLSEDKIEQTIERAGQFTQKVVVEDIKPAKAEEKVAEGEDELKKQAEEIVKKHSKNKQEIIKTKRYNKRSRRWKIILFVIIALLLLCAAFVGAHRFGLLKDAGFLKPVTDRLSYYVPVAEKQSVQQPVNTEEVAVETVTEESYTGEIAYEGGEPTEQEAVNNVQPQTNQTAAQKAPVANNRLQKKTQQTETSNQTAPTVKEEPVQEDNTPVVTQNYSKLGFDVVSGSFADKTKAEAQARKAKRLGYDGYVLAKIKSGTPVYYVSYGSRRTLSEANDLMQSMMNRLGGNYYVISR
ncbi:MAG: SPOR domain-containing protein, partial [Bacteroidales bacterium]|nr:SPOR domain-containing protein [Bacteroidales bacterium]